MTSPPRLLVGGIGYRNLRDHSAGLVVLERLQAEAWPAHVSLEDISYGPIAVVQRLEDEPDDARFARAIVVSAVPREGRAPGTLTAYRWDGALPDGDVIQQAVGEAVTGVIAMDNTLMVGRHFAALPEDLVVVEIAPETHEFGEPLTPAVAEAVDSAVELIGQLARDGGEWTRLPVAPLGGPDPADAPLRGPDLLAEIETLIASLDAHPDEAVRRQVAQLLQGIDAVHRAGLTHLMTVVRGMAGEAFVNRLIADPAIRLLLMSYSLVPVDRRLQAEEAVDAVRGHLHAHGIDVELLEVVGGVVYARLHGLDASPLAGDAVRRDLEAALREGLLGFQELVLRPREQPLAQPAVIPLGSIQGLRRPVYRTAMPLAELPAGAMRAIQLDGQALLLVHADGAVHAVRNRCGDGALPLEFGALRGAELECSWHGCRYDVRTGRRLDGDGPRLQVFPVSVDDDHIRVALDVEAAGARA